MNAGRLLQLMLLAGLVAVSSTALAQRTIGEAKIIVRIVNGIIEEERRTLVVADPVHFKETIETGPDSIAKMDFIDGTQMSTGPNARVVLDEFVFAADPSDQRLVVGLTKGMMRFVTGSMPSAAYRVKVDDTVIGFRGSTAIISKEHSTVVMIVGNVVIDGVLVESCPTNAFDWHRRSCVEIDEDLLLAIIEHEIELAMHGGETEETAADAEGLGGGAFKDVADNYRYGTLPENEQQIAFIPGGLPDTAGQPPRSGAPASFLNPFVQNPARSGTEPTLFDTAEDTSDMSSDQVTLTVQ